MLFTGALILGALTAYAVHEFQSAGPLQTEQNIVVARGGSVSQIAAQLHRENIIAHPLLFRIAARIEGDSLKAGEYQFAPRQSAESVLAKLSEGETFARAITFAEGLTVHQFADRLNKRDDLSGDIKELPLEGTLMPDTYQFEKGTARQDVVNRAYKAMQSYLDQAWDKRAENLPLETKKEALILASIVEKETGVAGERAKIAGVFINRLNIDMPLQTDPTILYGLTRGKVQEDGMGPIGRRLLRKDLEQDGPYNTYTRQGLPPTPIANPGRAAIDAVLNPARHDYLYFVADGSGGHAFAETLEGHNRNVAQWRKIRKNN